MPRIPLIVSVGLAALLCSSAAHADKKVLTPDLHINTGPVLGIVDVGHMNLFGLGVHGSVEKRYGEYYVSAEVDHAIGSHYEPNKPRIRGTTTRVGAGVRFPLFTFGKRHIRGGMWGYVGVGRQRIRIDEGGVDRRNDIAVGLWTRLIAKPKTGRGTMRHHGFRFGVRMLLADSPEQGPLSTPGGTDLAMLMDLSFSLGR